MSAFGYDYFTDHYGAERERAMRLLQFQGLRGSGGDYAYEVLNLVNGRRTAQDIRDAVSAIYGPVPLELVVEYLRALESIRVIEVVSEVLNKGEFKMKSRAICLALLLMLVCRHYSSAERGR